MTTLQLAIMDYNAWADTSSEGLRTPLHTPERTSKQRTNPSYSAPDPRTWDDGTPYSEPSPQHTTSNLPPRTKSIPTTCNLRLVVLNASLSSFSSGYCCASIAGAILFLQQDTNFFPPNVTPQPNYTSISNYSNNYYNGLNDPTQIHSCFTKHTNLAPSSSSNSNSYTPNFSEFQRGLLVSCILLSALVGALFASSVADTIGRRPTQIFSNLFFIVGCGGMYFVPNNEWDDMGNFDDHGYWLLVSFRALTGLGVGVSSVVVNLYITEISPAKSRGELGSWAPFAVTAGILVSYILATFMGSTISIDRAWRYILGFGAVPAFVQMAIALFFESSLPESPRWLIMNGRPVRAFQSSVLLHGSNRKKEIQQELDDILLTMLLKHAGGPRRTATISQGGPVLQSNHVGLSGHSPYTSTNGSSKKDEYAAVFRDTSWNGGVATIDGSNDGFNDETKQQTSNATATVAATTATAAIAGSTDPIKVKRQRSDSHIVESEIMGVQGDMVEVDCCCRLCSRTKYRSAALAGIGINILQQLTGINIVIYFGPQLLKQTGFDSVQATALTAGVSVAQLIAVGILMKLVDRVGRRPLAFVGLGAMILGLATIATAFYMLCEGNANQAGTYAWVAVIGMLLFRIAFSISLGPLPYIVTAEVFPNEVRACGATVSWSANWIANFGVTLSFPLIKNYFAVLVGGREELGSVCLFGIYIFFSLFAIGFIYKYVPETARKHLDQL